MLGELSVYLYFMWLTLNQSGVHFLFFYTVIKSDLSYFNLVLGNLILRTKCVAIGLT
ncbi:hypothetical protein DAI22_04g100800 [Oryza sativa Japonica Group]|nr:hypothetical protein DAI22_04g100800 [Oryza sativa Japonica Group]